MAELVDAIDSKSISARSAGSIPARGTTFLLFSWALPIRLHPLRLAATIAAPSLMRDEIKVLHEPHGYIANALFALRIL